MEFIITLATIWLIVKLLGLPLFILSVIALFKGSLPDNDPRTRGGMARWSFWRAFALWLIIIFIRGLVL